MGDVSILYGKRASGKTFAALTTVYHHAETHPNARIAIMAATAADGVRMLGEYMAHALDSGLAPTPRFDRKRGVITHANGSTVRVHTHEHQLRGQDLGIVYVNVTSLIGQYRHLAFRGHLILETDIESDQLVYGGRHLRWGDSIIGGKPIAGMENPEFDNETIEQLQRALDTVVANRKNKS